MKLQPLMQHCLDDWSRISGLDFCLLTEDDQVFASTGQRALPSAGKLQEFRDSDDMSLVNSSCLFFKVMDQRELLYLLLVYGKAENARTIGELAVCQIRSLAAACSEKNDKSQFLKDLLLGHYRDSEIASRARRLHLHPDTPRILFLIEPRTRQDEHALATVRNLFSSRSRDIVLEMDDSRILVIRELTQPANAEDPEQTASILVDMLGTEALTPACVSYSRPAEDLTRLPDAWREACTALEIGRTFYAERNVFGYDRLGIGRLIYQLPDDICEMFLAEVFKEQSLADLDEESLITIRTFFENNLNMAETARQLYQHRNTLIYRFEKLQKKYGLDIRTFEDALTFKIAMLVTDYMKTRNK